MKQARAWILSAVGVTALLSSGQPSALAQSAPAPATQQGAASPRRDELPADLPESQREFIERHSFDNPLFRDRQLRVQSAAGGQQSAAAGQPAQEAAQGKEVRMIYLVPADKAARPDYTIAIQNAILHLQAFYRDQMGNGQVFGLHSPVVEVYKTPHAASFYSTGPNATTFGFWNNVLADGFALTGGGFNDPNNRWIFYIDAPTGCGQVVGGNAGVALLPANDLRGLTGQTNIPACPNEFPDNAGVCRWVGGLGHELGHSFNLPHPPGCDQNNTALCGSHERGSLMFLGYATFPNTHLLEQDKSSLMATGFLAPFNLATPGASFCASMLEQSPNPVDDAAYFVRWNYKDFLAREADDAGASFWTGQITSCGSDAACVENRRINVSAAFFLSIEFQETGFLVYRAYKAAYGDLPGQPVPLKREEFVPDARRVAQDVVVNQGDWETLLENNKRAYFDAFVARPRFAARYPSSMTPEQFVNTLNTNALGALSTAERDALVADLGANRKTRAQVLRAVAEDADLARGEKNRAFVLMQYYGYLQRNPDDAPEPGLDFRGFNFWLGKLGDHNGDFVAAEMVKSFLVSAEYRGRFGRP